MNRRLESSMYLVAHIPTICLLILWLEKIQALTIFSNGDFVSQFAIRHERLSAAFYIPRDFNLKMLIDHRLSMTR